MSESGSDLVSPTAIAYAFGARLPIIGISSRQSALSDKGVFPSFLRVVPPNSHQADVWVRLLCRLQWRSTPPRIVFIHSADPEGRAALGRFQAATASPCPTTHRRHPPDPWTGLEDADGQLQTKAVIEFQPGLNSLEGELRGLKGSPAKVYILYSSQADAEVIFQDAAQLTTAEGVVWLVSESALGAKNVPVGALGLRLVGATEESYYLTDAVSVLTTALGNGDIAEDCLMSAESEETGPRLFRSMVNMSIQGVRGRVSFDENGDRRDAAYDVVNLQRTGEVHVGQYRYSAILDDMELWINEEKLIWPGNQRRKPQGNAMASHLRIVTIGESPFVYVRRLTITGTDGSSLYGNSNWDHEKNLRHEEHKDQRGGDGVSMQWIGNACFEDEVPCPRPQQQQSGEVWIEHFCCKGYCIDLLKELSKKLNFTYSLSLVPDGEYGSYVMKNKSGGDKKQWTGMIGEIVADRSDMIIAPLTITPERSEFMEFSKPFKYQGITILERKPSRSSTLVSFLQPFDNSLWMLVLVSVHVVALVLCLLDRFSPFSRYKSVPPPPTDASSATGTTAKRVSCTTIPKGVEAYTEEDALNLSSAIWFAWGVLLNSGIGEGAPRSLSAKVLGVVWAAFAMMTVASYTANLAAFLVLERPYAKPIGLQDAILLNRFGNLTAATVRGSAVEMFFQRQVELTRLHEDMAAMNYGTADEAIQDVRNGKLKAFIWDSSRLELEAAMDCELVTTGELFGQSGYGVGLQKDSSWTSAITLAILEMHEGGTMESLDKKWFAHLSKEAPGIQCDGIQPGESTPTSLGLKNMAGVFILVLAGIFGGAALLVIEVTYKRHHAKMLYRRELARYAFDKWRRVIVKRRYIRAAIAAQKQKQMTSNGTESMPLRSPQPQEWTFGTLIPSSVGTVGSMAAAAAKVDLIQQMSPRVENIDSFDSFDDIDDVSSYTSHSN
ncbi:glutamate [NMDA] receptor subunit 1-like [Ischnura elegans]|uniref:glutamate [NMDA] receptor subunit 1-like n=1 Tax=Ischnura elegans TaxID=197161 RepID=UPI001ED875A1|nr:glutamate [NMDA] receptor subunit 1-like [Ischnura elegans]